MGIFFLRIRHSLVFKLILSVGITLLVIIGTWSFFNLQYQRQRIMEDLMSGSDRLSSTIMLGTHYAMMINSRDDITRNIKNMGRQKDIEAIRIYNKQGQIKFSSRSEEVDRITNIRDEACHICHHSEPPLVSLELEQRIRIFKAEGGRRYMGIISPIFNEPGCATGDCHVHPDGKKILGALDVVVSLSQTDAEIIKLEKGLFAFAVAGFSIMSLVIFGFVYKFVNQPISRLINSSKRIQSGDYSIQLDVYRKDEIGQLEMARNEMVRAIAEKELELNRQRNLYQNLFEQVPCLITVQDRNYKLLQYNREFAEMFDPDPEDYCYHAYKSRDQKCPDCPVEKTFRDGLPQISEETGFNKDGSPAHWLVRTSPIRNAKGEIIAAMEISLDLTPHHQLQEKLEASEQKYHDFFNNIPNPLFVLDQETLTILDCNKSVTAIYGYREADILGKYFTELFPPEDREVCSRRLRKLTVINQAKNIHKDGKILFVDIWVAPLVYAERKVLLVTTSDITKRLEAEQQLIHASKMATLGEMATGIAHELNQPLTVIKTAGTFLLRRLEQKKEIEADILMNMSSKINNNVDRATKIINHMRQFARKSDLVTEKVQINTVLERAYEIFSQQFKARGIEAEWALDANLPKVQADPDRLEQVFINLLLNARDAIEELQTGEKNSKNPKVVSFKTRKSQDRVITEIADSGKGIPGAIRDKIFEPFFTTKEVGSGTGLGLSISYGIIKDFDGTIQVHSKEGEGTTFVISFPIKVADE